MTPHSQRQWLAGTSPSGVPDLVPETFDFYTDISLRLNIVAEAVMTKIFGILIFGFVCHAAATFISQTDDLYAQETGVKNIQFVMGGDRESITGEVDKAAIRRSFMANVVLHYKCYSKFYGGSAEKLGINILRFDLDASAPTYDPKSGAVAPSNFKVDSIGLDEPKFVECIKNEWGRVKMMAPPQGMVVTVAMPIEGKPRKPSNK